MGIRIFTQSVYGLQARIKAGLEDTVRELEPDIICLQKLSCQEEALPKDFLSDYHCCFDNKNAVMWRGLGTWLRKTLFTEEDAARVLLGRDRGTAIGNVIGGKYNLVNAYVKPTRGSISTITDRIDWNSYLFKNMEKMAENGLPFILLGDLQVAMKNIDIGSDTSNSGISEIERMELNKIMARFNLVDPWRERNLHTVAYTQFSYNGWSEMVGRGMRYDYILVDEELSKLVTHAEIVDDMSLACGSNHKIVLLDIEI